MNFTVAGLLAAYRDDRLDPVAIVGGFDPAAAAAGEEAGRRWRAGTARALEGVPVRVTDAAAREFAAEQGAIPVDAPGAPLTLGGGTVAVLAAAKAGGAALLAQPWPAIAARGADDLAVVLGALGQSGAALATRAARIAGTAPSGGAERRGDDLAASLLGGLGLAVRTLSVEGAGRFAAAAADADVLLLPAEGGLLDEAARAGLAVLALPGSWDKGGHLGVVLAGRIPLTVTQLGVRLSAAMGGV